MRAKRRLQRERVGWRSRAHLRVFPCLGPIFWQGFLNSPWTDMKTILNSLCLDSGVAVWLGSLSLHSRIFFFSSVIFHDHIRNGHWRIWPPSEMNSPLACFLLIDWKCLWQYNCFKSLFDPTSQKPSPCPLYRSSISRHASKTFVFLFFNLSSFLLFLSLPSPHLSNH